MGNYVEWYQKIKEMGKDKGWSDHQIQMALLNREKTEQDYRRVSYFYILDLDAYFSIVEIRQEPQA